MEAIRHCTGSQRSSARALLTERDLVWHSMRHWLVDMPDPGRSLADALEASQLHQESVHDSADFWLHKAAG